MIVYGNQTCQDAPSNRDAQRIVKDHASVFFSDNLVIRKHRPHQIWRKMLPGVLAQLGISGAKAKWSQKAGCRCPCSPGFILDVSVNDGDHNRVDIYVTV